MSDPFPLEIDVETLSIRQVNTEWELKIEKSDGDTLYEYVDMIDPLFEQLVEQGEIEL